LLSAQAYRVAQVVTQLKVRFLALLAQSALQPTLQSVGEAALGATGAAAPIVGNAVINAGLSGIAAAATGGNIGKSMLDGAIKGAAVAGATEFAEAILGKDNIASLAEATGLDKKQVESIFTTSVANGVTAEVSGQGEFLETLGISLVAQGVGAKSANLMQRCHERCAG
jgi:hypothetical protein